MFTNEPIMLFDGKICDVGTIVGFEVMRDKSYISPKTQNGLADIIFSSNQIEDDVLPWVYIGTTNRKKKKCYAFMLLKPQFPTPLLGAAGYVNAKEIIDNVSNLLEVERMFDIANVTMPEMMQIFGLPSIEIEDLDQKLFVYGKSDYSPESFLKDEFEKEGKLETALTGWIYDLQEESILLPNEPYWISTFSKNIVSKEEIHFCISAYIDKEISPNCTLFTNKGEEKMGFLGVRPIIYFECSEQREEKKIFNALTEYIQEQIERYGIGVRAF